MAALSANLRNIFGKTKLVVLPEDYLMIRLPVDTKPISGEWYRRLTTRYAVFVREPKDITLIVTRRKWLRMQPMFRKPKVSEPMKVIIFDVELGINVYGFIAAISKVLADAKISLMPVSSFHRDHILVRKKDLPRSVRLLREFLDQFVKTKARMD
jgi:hypothetical protein